MLFSDFLENHSHLFDQFKSKRKIPKNIVLSNQEKEAYQNRIETIFYPNINIIQKGT